MWGPPGGSRDRRNQAFIALRPTLGHGNTRSGSPTGRRDLLLAVSAVEGHAVTKTEQWLCLC